MFAVSDDRDAPSGKHSNRDPGRQLFHLIPPHEYHLCDAKNLIEDDEPFDMSDQACAEREDRWYRQMLSTDQQLQLLDTSYPLSEDLVSPYNKYVLKDMATAGKYGHMEVNPDDLGWQELNPRYLSDFGLWVSTTSILPASVTDTRYHEHQTSSPFQPAFGPFKVRSHFCKPKKGICKTCGRYNITKSGRNEQYHERKGVTAQATTSSTRTDLDWPHSKLFGCYGATVDQGEHQPRGDCDEQGDSFMSEN